MHSFSMRLRCFLPAPEWSLCHCSASLAAAFVGGHLAVSEQERIRQRRVEMMDAVNFIANELLENAVKYGQRDLIDLSVQVGEDHILCVVGHYLSREAAQNLSSIVQGIRKGDPVELCRWQAENNVRRIGSGLGYLLILSDYDARLSWKLQMASPTSKYLTITAELAI